MTKAIFEEWILDFDKHMRKEKRKVSLLIDNAFSHVTSVRLEKVEPVYLPSNTTSKL